jgi:hypothetical protein
LSFSLGVIGRRWASLEDGRRHDRDRSAGVNVNRPRPCSSSVVACWRIGRPVPGRGLRSTGRRRRTSIGPSAGRTALVTSSLTMSSASPVCSAIPHQGSALRAISRARPASTVPRPSRQAAESSRVMIAIHNSVRKGSPDRVRHLAGNHGPG